MWRARQLYGLFLLVLLGGSLPSSSLGQDYDHQDYSQDNLYHDYAMKQQQKEAAKGAGGGGWGKLALGVSMGWFVGAKYHCKKLQKKLNAKHKADQKQLYTQYYNDVYTLQQQNAELATALEQQLGLR